MYNQVLCFFAVIIVVPAKKIKLCPPNWKLFDNFCYSAFLKKNVTSDKYLSYYCKTNHLQSSNHRNFDHCCEPVSIRNITEQRFIEKIVIKDIRAPVKLSLGFGTLRWSVNGHTKSHECLNYQLPLITVPPKFKLPKDPTNLVLVVEKSKGFLGIYPANIDNVDGVICKIPSCRQDSICAISGSAAFQYNKCGFLQACFT